MAMTDANMGMNREGKLVDYTQPKQTNGWCNEFLHQLSDKPVEYGLTPSDYMKLYHETGMMPTSSYIAGIDPYKPDFEKEAKESPWYGTKFIPESRRRKLLLL